MFRFYREKSLIIKTADRMFLSIMAVYAFFHGVKLATSVHSPYRPQRLSFTAAITNFQ